MARVTASHHPVITLVPLDPASEIPLREQIYVGLRRIILTGKLAAGDKLPSTRMLATELRVSRNTVLGAFDQLSSEGYLEARSGGGTYVAPILPDATLAVSVSPATVSRGGARLALSKRGKVLAGADVEWATHPRKPVAFKLGVPAVDAFPFDLWSRLTIRVLRRQSPQLFGYGAPLGLARLRSAVASYLVAARGVRCEPEQVLIVEGAQAGLDLTMKLLLDPGDCAWIEDPGFPGARAAFQANGSRLIPVPLDEQGIDLVAGIRRGKRPRMIYVTPSHQFPMGFTMSSRRRSELLQFAADNDSWIIEDDYLSEFRYLGRPVQSLQGMDADGRVIYIGSFSKMIFPALRLAYIVIPPHLVDAFTAARAASTLQASTPMQAVIAEFMTEGHFVRHLRRMRNLYWERQQVLLKAAASELDGLLSVAPAHAGMHVVGLLPEGVDDVAASLAAAAAGVETVPLSSCYLGSDARHGLLLGYPGIRPPLIARAVRELSVALAR